MINLVGTKASNMSLLPWQTVVLTHVLEETANTRRFCFELKDGQHFKFEPGQFITLDLPIHERASKRLRSYSIASWPSNTPCFELVIVLLDGGAGTSWLFENGKAGLELPMRGPLGHFTLPPNIERDICMVCTGTGIAPFRSMVQFLYHQNAFSHHIHLVFGSRKLADILYYDELKKLSTQTPFFHYHVTLSRETPETWGGEIGYVHQVYEKICQSGERDMDFYLCGWKNMVDEARDRIKNLGYDKERIHLELYG